MQSTLGADFGSLLFLCLCPAATPATILVGPVPFHNLHGAAPEDGVKNYFLFLPRTYLQGPGTVLTLVLRGLPVSKAEFDPTQPGGVAPAPKRTT